MTVHFRLRRSPFAFLLLPTLVWACSSAEPAGPARNDSMQHIDGSKAGTSAKDEPGSGSSGGSPGEEPDEGSGNTGSVGRDEPSEQPSTGGKSGQPAEPEPGEGEGGSPGEPTPAEPSEAFLRGQALVVHNECTLCHQENFAGFTVFPNITPDVATGIGAWTDEQIVSAIRDGIDPEGSPLCETMMRYPMTDDEASDVVAFLRGIPSVSNRITSDCP